MLYTIFSVIWVARIVFLPNVIFVQGGGDLMLDLFDCLFLTVELISLAIQILEFKADNRATNTVVITININL